MDAAVYGGEAEFLPAAAHPAPEPPRADVSRYRNRKLALDAAVDGFGPELGVERRRNGERDIAVDRLECCCVVPVGAPGGGRDRSVYGSCVDKPRGRQLHRSVHRVALRVTLERYGLNTAVDGPADESDASRHADGELDVHVVVACSRSAPRARLATV